MFFGFPSKRQPPLVEATTKGGGDHLFLLKIIRRRLTTRGVHLRWLPHILQIIRLAPHI
jgi:hypothetical protein